MRTLSPLLRLRDRLGGRETLPQWVRVGGLLTVALSSWRRNLLIRDSNVDCVVWTHSGVGDILSQLHAISHFASSRRRVVLPILPHVHMALSALLEEMSSITPVILEYPTRGNSERNQVGRISRALNLPVVTAGHETYAAVARLFPDRSLNWQLNASAGLDVSDLRIRPLLDLLLEQDQIVPPEERYAFVDHHPGTAREIPVAILESIRDRGLNVLLNPRREPLLRLAAVMDRADELHCVSSAPLCLALAGDLAKGRRFRYRTAQLHPLLLDYPSDWVEIALELVERDTVVGSTVVDRWSEYQVARSSARRLEPLREWVRAQLESVPGG